MSSGLLIGATASSASAAPAVSTLAVPNVNVSAVAEQARDALASSPTISVEATASFSLSSVDVDAEAPPPPPPPVVVRATAAAPAATTTAAASRTVERTATATATAESAPVAAPSSDTVAAVLEIARRYIGTPYVSGGAAPGGFDCSGFTQYVFAQVGISLPRTSGDQRYAGTVVSAADARPGDLVWSPGHVGIYTGNGQHIAARNYSTPLAEGPIYQSNPVFIRVIG